MENSSKREICCDYEEIRRSDRASQWNTVLDEKAKTKDLDKFLGCLIGGAAGDALGYPVEFLSESDLLSRYGKQGITEYHVRNGVARISDDTQMTLFTANGLLVGKTRGCLRGIQGPYSEYVAQAYREWHKTQVCNYPAVEEFQSCWLINVPQLYFRRAPEQPV